MCADKRGLTVPVLAGKELFLTAAWLGLNLAYCIAGNIGGDLILANW